MIKFMIPILLLATAMAVADTVVVTQSRPPLPYNVLVEPKPVPTLKCTKTWCEPHPKTNPVIKEEKSNESRVKSVPEALNEPP